MNESREEYLNNRDLPKYKIGDLIIMKQRPQWVNKELNFKLATKNTGPFKIIQLVPDRNHVLIELTNSKSLEVHIDDIMPYKGEIQSTYQPKRFNSLPNEIIFMDVPEDIPSIDVSTITNICLPDDEKSKFNIRTIVGQYIAVFWTETNAYEIGMVIGHTTAKTANLVYFFDRRLDTATNELIPKEDDFYKINLFPRKNQVKLTKWSLIDIKKINNNK